MLARVYPRAPRPEPFGVEHRYHGVGGDVRGRSLSGTGDAGRSNRRRASGPRPTERARPRGHGSAPAQSSRASSKRRVSAAYYECPFQCGSTFLLQGRWRGRRELPRVAPRPSGASMTLELAPPGLLGGLAGQYLVAALVGAVGVRPRPSASCRGEDGPSCRDGGQARCRSERHAATLRASTTFHHVLERVSALTVTEPDPPASIFVRAVDGGQAPSTRRPSCTSTCCA